MLDNHFRYGQSESHPTLVNFLRLAQFSKELEQLLNRFRFDPDPSVIHYGRQHLRLPLIPDTDCDPSLESELDRVANEVEKYLSESLYIGFQHLRDRAIDLRPQVELLLAHLEVHDRGHLLDHLPNVDEGQVYFKLIIFDATEIQSILNHILQMKSTVLYYSKEFNGAWVRYYPQQNRSYRYNRVERRPQLVGD